MAFSIEDLVRADLLELRLLAAGAKKVECPRTAYEMVREIAELGEQLGGAQNILVHEDDGARVVMLVDPTLRKENTVSRKGFGRGGSDKGDSTHHDTGMKGTDNHTRSGDDKMTEAHRKQMTEQGRNESGKD